MNNMIKTILGLLVLSNVATADKCLVMGLVPAEDPRAMMAQYKPMAKWLEKEIGTCITLKNSTDYTGIIEAMRAKRVDIAWFGPFAYVLAHDRADAEAFAVGVNSSGESSYKSYLVATPKIAKKLNISQRYVGEDGMKDLVSKLEKNQKKFTFAFTDPASASGFAAPKYYMHKAGMNPKKMFKKVAFVGTHDAAELVIKNEVIDIVADNDINYKKMQKDGKINESTNVIIWESDSLEGSPLAYRGSLNDTLKAKIKSAIVNIPKDIVTGYGSIVGYKIVNDDDYQIIKDIKKTIDSVN